MLPNGRLIHATKSGVVHRKKCRHPKTPADLMRRYCLVCGCKAENYNFGVISCESCKAFFRRNAHKQTLGAAGFACSFRRGGCVVSLATRKKCPGCRLSKCYSVGMQADLIQKADQLFFPSESLAGHSPSSAASMPMSTGSSSASSFASSAFHAPASETPMPPPPLLQHCQQPRRIPLPAQLLEAAGRTADQSEHLLRLWQRLQLPEPKLSPSSYTEPDCNEASVAGDHRCANILLIEFYFELRQLVQDTMLCDIKATADTEVAILEAFVHQAAKFIAGLRQMNQLDRPHFLALIRCRLHSVLFPLSCAGYCQAEGKFSFTIQGHKMTCHPIQLFINLVRRTSSHLVDYTPLAEFETYISLLQEVTEMRPELIALFCAAKLLYLPPEDCSEMADNRLIDACSRLGRRYHQHLVDSLYYHYPFNFDEKLNSCCRLFKWSLAFDRTLQSFIQYCPLTSATANDDVQASGFKSMI